MQTQVTCPNCQTPYTAEVHQVVDAEQNPELKARLLNGVLNVAVCPNCGAGGQISTPLLYHDPEHELFMVHVPQELNLDQVQREQLIGQLTRQVMDQLPSEKRRAYMLQPQMVLSMQTFLEKVLETEGITREMIERQRQQSELLRTLVRADKDVVDHLIEERKDEIDETFFAMLQQLIDSASQMEDNSQLLPLINLRAKLMTETEVGRKLEQQQIALHALNQEAKKEGGLTPALLLKHVLANQEDEGTVDAIVAAGQPALNYEFFRLLSEEIEEQEKAGAGAAAKRLTQIRTRLLATFEQMQQQSQQAVAQAQSTLQTILSAEDKKAAVSENLDQIDDVFMYLLSAQIAQAEQQGQTRQLKALTRVHTLIVEEMESQLPPEVRLLNQLLRVETEAEQRQLLDESQQLISPNLLQMVEAVQEQVQESDQEELDDRLDKIKAMIELRL